MLIPINSTLTKWKKRNLAGFEIPDSGSGGEYDNIRKRLRRRDLIHLESPPHGRGQLHHIASAEAAEELGGGAGDALHQEFKHSSRSSERWRRCYGEEGGLGGILQPELEVLAGSGVGGGDVGGVGDVDGDVEEGVCGGGDGGEWGGGPDGGVLAEGGGDGGEAADGQARAAEEGHGGGIEAEEREAGRRRDGGESECHLHL